MNDSMRSTPHPEEPEPESPRCSFCGKGEEVAKAIFSQNHKSICVDCLKTYEKKFSDETQIVGKNHAICGIGRLR